MAKKEDKKKKNKYSRKPATLMTQGLKATKSVMDAAEQAAKAGKRAMHKGKITKTEKDLLVMKSVTDPADKVAIAKAKTMKGRDKAIKSEPSQKAIIRNTKNVGKRAGKEVKKVADAKYAKSQASQDAQKMRDRNAIAKAKILKDKAKRKEIATGKNIPVIKNYTRKGEESQKAFNKKADKASGVPEGAHEKRMPIEDVLKPISKANIKKGNALPKVPEVGKITQVKSKPKIDKSKVAKVAAGGAALTAAGVLVNAKRKKDARTVEKSPESIKQSPKSPEKGIKTPTKATNDSGRSAPTNKGVQPRSGVNAKLKPEVKKETGKAPSVTTTVDNVLGDKKVSTNQREELNQIARTYITKNKKSNVPWEKLIESLTILLSSHIMSKGISKRYK